MAVGASGGPGRSTPAGSRDRRCGWPARSRPAAPSAPPGRRLRAALPAVSRPATSTPLDAQPAVRRAGGAGARLLGAGIDHAPPCRVSRSASCNASVDLPMPGSPASSTAAARDHAAAEHASSAGMSQGTRSTRSCSTSPSGDQHRAAAPRPRPLLRRPRRPPRRGSTRSRTPGSVRATSRTGIRRTGRSRSCARRPWAATLPQGPEEAKSKSSIEGICGPRPGRWLAGPQVPTTHLLRGLPAVPEEDETEETALRQALLAATPRTQESSVERSRS